MRTPPMPHRDRPGTTSGRAATAMRPAAGPQVRRAVRRVLTGFFVLLTALAAAGSASAASPESVFHIDRNKNRNQVHYGVHLDAACRPIPPEPMYNYWVRREEDPVEIRPLWYFQQAAYGFQKQHVESDGRVEVRLRALPDRQLVVRAASVDGKCKAETFITIAGKQAYLDKVFVFAEEGLLLPTVRYIELFGRTNDGLAVYEKILVDE